MPTKSCRCLFNIIHNFGLPQSQSPTSDQKQMNHICLQACMRTINSLPTQNKVGTFSIMVPEGIMKCTYNSKITSSGTTRKGNCTFEIPEREI